MSDVQGQVQRILFSPIGKSDPVRTLHDGPMMHIIRHYHPDKVYLFLTAELLQLEEETHCYSLAVRALSTTCQIEVIKSGIRDASNMSAFVGVYNDWLNIIHAKYPEATIITNNSSGTPQMLLALTLDTMRLAFPVIAVQVKTPAKRSNFEQPEDLNKQSIQDLLDANYDNEVEAENRCVELDYALVKRHEAIVNIQTLIDEYDYAGALTLIEKEGLTSFFKQKGQKEFEVLCQLLQVGKYKVELQWTKADILLAKPGLANTVRSRLKNDSKLNGDERSRAVIEMFMSLQVDRRQQRKREFLLKMSPLLKEVSLLCLLRKCNIRERTLLKSGEAQDIYNKEGLKAEFKFLGDSFFSSGVYANLSKNIKILSVYSRQTEKDGLNKIVNKLEVLREIERLGRNQVAHEITPVHEEGLKREFKKAWSSKGLSDKEINMSDDLFSLLEEVIAQVVTWTLSIKRDRLVFIFDILNSCLRERLGSL
ncbi:MAG: hypothetical protein SOY70_05635 [Veillonellaceae bacterium]|nr:hypothetical protein [Veillonellaceae bacterium]